MDANTPRDVGYSVRDHASRLGMYMLENKVPMDIGMAALAMTLATAARQSGFSRHEAISRFVSSVNLVYPEQDNGSNACIKG